MIKLIIELCQANGIDFGFFRLANYITFRALMGMVFSLMFCLIYGSDFIVFLYKKGMKDTSGEASVSSYSKKGTPTAGGLLIIISTVVSLFFWGDFRNTYVLVLLAGFLYTGFVGFIDDFLKVRFKSSLSGLSQMGKTLMLFAFIIPFAIFYLSSLNPMPEGLKTLIYLPFYKNPVMALPDIIFGVFVVFTMFSIINAVNIVDGMDGLLGGTSVLAIGVYTVFAYVIGNKILAQYLLFPYIPGTEEIVIFCSILIGGIVGFLWFNTYPAEIFMGDTGSLAIGSVIGMVAFFLKQEFLFLIVGGLFVFEIFTSLLQEKIGSKLGRRMLYRAPYHHTLTHKGIAEPKAVVRLWLISVILALIGLLSLKIR